MSDIDQLIASFEPPTVNGQPVEYVAFVMKENAFDKGSGNTVQQNSIRFFRLHGNLKHPNMLRDYKRKGFRLVKFLIQENSGDAEKEALRQECLMELGQRDEQISEYQKEIERLKVFERKVKEK